MGSVFRRVAILVCAVCMGLPTFAAEQSPPPLPDLVSLNEAHDGQTITLVARPQTHHVGDVSFAGYAYNGSYAGPLIHARPGETLAIKLVNELPEETNLHFHGMQTGPRANGDNVHLIVLPGHSFLYRFTIPPYQPPGLYWYHAHIHKLSEDQVAGGLSGALLVEGFADPFPALKNLRQRILTVKARSFDETDDPIIDRQYHRIVQTLNGQTLSSITMAPHTSELWQISNQSADLFFHLAIPGMTIRFLGEDGVARNQDDAIKVVDIAAAKRVAILVTAGEPGAYALVSQKVATGVGDAYAQNRTLANITVTGDPGRETAALTGFPAREDLRKRRIDVRREITYTQAPDGKTFMIDGKKFDPNRIDVRVPLGNTEEWTIHNDTDDVHTFHIHQVHFQVLSVDGTPQPFNGYVDTVVVHERERVTVILPFDKPNIVGRFMYHCHLLEHEDGGMMQQIEVYDPADAGALRDLWRNSVRRLQAAFPGSQICRIRD